MNRVGPVHRTLTRRAAHVTLSRESGRRDVPKVRPIALLALLPKVK